MTEREIFLMRERDALAEEVKQLKSKLQRMQDKAGLAEPAKIGPPSQGSPDASHSSV